MATFHDESFLLGIQHLDTAGREIFDDQMYLGGPGQRGVARGGVIDESTLRFVDTEVHADAYAVARRR